MSSRAEKARSTGRRRVHPPTRSRAVALFLRFIVYLLFSFRESAAAAASRSRAQQTEQTFSRRTRLHAIFYDLGGPVVVVSVAIFLFPRGPPSVRARVHAPAEQRLSPPLSVPHVWQ